MPVLTHEITEAETGRTVKSIALKEMRLSRGRFSSLKFNGGIRLDGESIREYAARIGADENNISQKLKRAEKKLRESYKDRQI